MRCRHRALDPIQKGMSLPENQHELTVVAEDDLLACWAELQVNQGRLSHSDAVALCRWHTTGELPSDPAARERLRKTIELLLGNVGTGQSAIAASRLLRDFRGVGRYVERTYNGSRYIIFKGYAGLRSRFTGTRYLASNPRLVSMGIGRLGVRQTALAGARVTIVLLGGYRILDYLLRDEATLTQLIGRLATDVVKISASAVLGYAAGAVAASIGVVGIGIVAGPLVVSIIIGTFVGAMLEVTDERFKLTEQLIAHMESVVEATVLVATDPRFVVCRTRESLIEVVNAWAADAASAARRGVQRQVDRIIGPTFFPGWHHLPR